jgi:ABC-2 type transport system ATP-binding protein
MSKILEIKNMKKRIGKFILDDINLTLDSGYIMGLIGKNGAGKTSLLRTIMNYYVKDYGEINIFDKDNFKYEKMIKNKVGYVSDEMMFFDDLKINRMKDIVKVFYSDWDDEKFYNYLERFELDKNKKIGKLSKGNYKKFAITMALSHNPDLLILDEPTSDLDPIFRSEFLDLLLDFVSNEKRSVIFSSHITQDLDKIADYVVFIDEGKVKLNMTKEEIGDKYFIVKGKKDFESYFNDEKFVGISKKEFGCEGLCMNSEYAKYLEGKGCILEIPTLEKIMFYCVSKKNGKQI